MMNNNAESMPPCSHSVELRTKKPWMLTNAVARAVEVAIYRPTFFFIAINGIDTISSTDEM